MTTTLADQVAELSARLAALSDEVTELRRENAHLRARTDAESADHRGYPPERRVSRRGLLAAVGGAAAGMIGAGAVAPAGAANGDNLVLGVDTNAATATTKVTTTTGTGLHGVSSHQNGSGLVGEASGVASSAVRALSTSTTGFAIGMEASAASNDGIAVQGYAFSESGQTTGVYGITTSPHANACGVRGLSQLDSGSATGVLGESYSMTGFGVRGRNGASSGTASGVKGTTTSTAGRGVYGEATATTGTNYGVYGYSASSTGFALYGQGRMKVTGRSYLATPNSAPTDAHLNAGSISFYLNQAANQLKVRVKYSNGALKTATIALA